MFKQINIKGVSERPGWFFYDLGTRGYARVEMRAVDAPIGRYAIDIRAVATTKKGKETDVSTSTLKCVVSTQGLGVDATLHPMWLRSPKPRTGDMQVVTELPATGEHGDLLYLEGDNAGVYRFDRGALESMRQMILDQLVELIDTKNASQPAQTLGF